MGTRCLTTVYDTNCVPLVTLYRQFDGYPTGHGAELADFLRGMVMVNGLRGEPRKQANGAGCLAAQIVAHFKEGAGGFYLVEPDSAGHNEEYYYEVRPGGEGGAIRLVVKSAYGRNPLLYDGPADSFDPKKCEREE